MLHNTRTIEHKMLSSFSALLTEGSIERDLGVPSLIINGLGLLSCSGEDKLFTRLEMTVFHEKNVRRLASNVPPPLPSTSNKAF